jgi:protein SCO1/2
MQRWNAGSLSRTITSLVTAASLIGFMAGCRPASFHGTAYEPPERAPEVVLQRASGGTFVLADQGGSVVLLFFGYTHCPDVCPTTLSDWKRVKSALGRDTSRVRFVFISVDPARDDPATLQRYVTRFDPGFIGATGDSVKLAGIEQAFHVKSAREDGEAGDGYVVTHPSQTFVVDKHGELRLLYSFGMQTADVVSDIRQLLRGA